jgi:FSR family fosmidomycin resistance protein-like MFS transporter
MDRRIATITKTTSTGILAMLGLMLAHFINDLYANFLPVYIPLLREKFTLSFTLIALLSSVFTVAASFFQLLFGHLADRFSCWPFVLLGPLFTGAFMSLVGVLPGYGFILGALLLSALGTAMFHPQATALSGRLFQGRRGLNVSLFIGAGMLGFSIGPAIMALLLQHWGLAASPIALVPLAILGLALWLVLRDLPYGRLQDRPAYSESEDPPTPIAPLALLWGLVVLRHAVLLSFMTFLIILLEGRGLGYLAGSLSLVGFLLVSAPAGIVGGHLSDRFGRWPVTIWTLWLGFLAMLGFLAARDVLSFIFLLLGGALLSASNPVIVAHAQELLPHRASTASALVMGVAWGVGGLLISLVGVLADAWNIERALWLTTLIAFASTVVLTLMGRRTLSG